MLRRLAFLALVLAFTFGLVPFAPFAPHSPHPPYSPYPPDISAAQDRDTTDAMARRVNNRVRALQAEADRLALQVRTLLGDLRQLELQRDIAAEQQKAAVAAVMTPEKVVEPVLPSTPPQTTIRLPVQTAVW